MEEKGIKSWESNFKPYPHFIRRFIYGHTEMNNKSLCLHEVFILEGDTDNNKQTTKALRVMPRDGKFPEEKLSRVGG